MRHWIRTVALAVFTVVLMFALSALAGCGVVAANKDALMRFGGCVATCASATVPQLRLPPKPDPVPAPPAPAVP